MTRSKNVLSFAAVMLTCAASFAMAMSGCMQDTATNYGPPTGLKGRTVPAPQHSGSGVVDEAGPPPDTNAACGGKGLFNPDGGGCTVSWSKDIFPKMAAGQSLGCSDGQSCHGKPASTTPPIPGDDATAAWNSLAQYIDPKADGKVYVDVCSNNPDNSAIKCNLSGACLADKMPLLPAAATPDDLAKIDSWLACGAPNN